MPDTFHALATPPGTSALAVIRVCGPDVPTLIEGIFGRSPTLSDSRRARFGKYRNRHGSILDEVLYTWFPADSAFTGRETLEISCHGNPLIVNLLERDLRERGSRPAEPGEFTRTAFLEGKIDLSQAEAVGDLIAARSDAALQSAHRQLAGGLGEEIDARVAEILAILAHLEAFIDFPEEDLPPEDRDGPLASLARTLQELDRMISTGDQRELLHRGIRTVIVGEVNAGKSSLLNRLLGEDRVIVSAEAGTTRDTIGETFALGKYCIQIYDTAGFREASDAIEKEGIRHTEKVYGAADFHLVVLDGTLPSPALPEPLLRRLTPQNALVVVNKSDRPSFQPHEDFHPELPRALLSAKTGSGMPEFLRLWENRIGRDLLAGADERILYNQRHIGFLRDCRRSLQNALARLKDGVETEYVTPDLRDALEALGSVVGTVDNEAMLDVLFGEFCIGK